MNPLTLLPLLAVAMAAPGVISPAGTLLTHQAVHLPLTQTIHYENRPVVTGYQSTILKPALAHAPLGLSGIAFARQVPEIPTNPAPPADFPSPAPPADLPVNASNPAPPADAPQPTIPSIPGQGGDNMNGTGSDSPVPPVPGIPGVAFLNTANLVHSVNPFQYSAVVPNTHFATVRAAQAGDFEPLVTKQRVLAPVRTHTQITPQYTQIQPEVQYRRVIQEVPVAAPVAWQTPVIQQAW